MPRHSTSLVIASLLLAPVAGCLFGEERVHISNVGQAVDGDMHSVVAVSEGESTLPLGQCDFTVETRGPGGVWQEVPDVTVSQNGPRLIDTVVVADNSGSEDGFLEDIGPAVDSFAHRILARAHDDRVGLVRVSTGASVLSELTAEESDIQSAVDEMFVANGWTALWDGVRMADEVLERGAQSVVDAENCIDTASRSIVLFTDGADNNSADEENSRYSDGIDSTMADAMSVSVNGISTPVHVVEVGDDIAVQDLLDVSSATGGLYRNIQTYGALVGVLHSAADRIENGVPMCFAPASCDHSEARVTIDFPDGTALVREFAIPSTCAAP